MKNVLITGVSRGIGYCLAERMLASEYQVFGVSRTYPKDLGSHRKFNHLCMDLASFERMSDDFCKFINERHQVKRFEYVFLNAGQFSQRISNVERVPLSEIRYLMEVNVWANKLILDSLFEANIDISMCIVSSSIAGVRARAGNGAYALTKAALNMLIRLYALECPGTFFAVLGLCNVHTSLSEQILSLPLEGKFPEQEKLRVRATAPGYVVTPQERAQHIHFLLENGLPKMMVSGEFVDIRDLLKVSC